MRVEASSMRIAHWINRSYAYNNNWAQIGESEIAFLYASMSYKSLSLRCSA